MWKIEENKAQPNNKNNHIPHAVERGERWTNRVVCTFFHYKVTVSVVSAASKWMELIFVIVFLSFAAVRFQIHTSIVLSLRSLSLDRKGDTLKLVDFPLPAFDFPFSFDWKCLFSTIHLFSHHLNRLRNWFEGDRNCKTKIGWYLIEVHIHMDLTLGSMLQ